MTSIERTGRTVEDAVEEALACLNASRAEVEIEVLDEGAEGEARVRVALRGEGTGARATAPGSSPESAAEQASAGPAAEAAEQAREVTQHILDLMGLDVTARLVRTERQQISLDVEGPDSRIVIGKHGQTLEALEHLIGLVVNKDTPRRWRVMVDAEAYQQRRRERREEELLAMVRADAERARETGQEAVIQYAVGPYERRIVHLAFKDDPEFTTYSEGEEPHRYVVISPRD